MRVAASLARGRTCGTLPDKIAVATPPASISLSDFCTDQFTISGLSTPISFMVCSQLGDAR
jgi:hypothetical protein